MSFGRSTPTGAKAVRNSWQPVELEKGGTFGPKHTCFEASGDPFAPLTLVWNPSFPAPDFKIEV
jgi:hypothetical protein